MRSVPNVGRAFFPLDEQLELLPGQMTPFLHECLVRLGSWMPFEQAVRFMNEMLRTSISQASGVRYTESAGAAYVAIQNAEVEALEESAPEPPRGAEKMLISADGAMVPLRQGEWAEVKTCVVGEVQTPVLEKEEWVVHTRQLSYFSRLTDAEQFSRLSLGEMHRRGVEHSRQVCAVQDGADWLQGFVDYHRPDAIRILDFPHAAQRITDIGQALFDETVASGWISERLHQLKHEGPSQLLVHLRQLQEQHPASELLQNNLAYLAKREAQLQYPRFQSLGWPIASGMTESANKLVVEARLKGAGMHWLRTNVNPILALRNIVCSDRWSQEWPRIAQQLRLEARKRRKKMRDKRRLAKALIPTQSVPIQPAVLNPPPLPSKPSLSQDPPVPTVSPQKRHPWRSGPAVLPGSHSSSFSKN
jgi:hypothetical protein